MAYRDSGDKDNSLGAPRMPSSQPVPQRSLFQSPTPTDSVDRVVCSVGDRSCATAHAATINRSAHRGSTSAEKSLLRLQRQYGNRYVGKVLNRASADSASGDLDSVERSIDQARSGGQGLDSTVRRQMETSIGADFSGVRVHNDAHADTLNRALSARAFTTGKDVFFRQGEYSPGTSAGRELLAHELTHVVQQNGDGIRRKMSVSEPGDPQELEADRVASAVMQRERQDAATPDPHVVSREEDEDKDKEVATRPESSSVQRQAETPQEDEEKSRSQGSIDQFVQRQPVNEAKSINSSAPVHRSIQRSCAVCSGASREEATSDSLIEKPRAGTDGDIFQSLDEEAVGADIGDQAEESDQSGGAGGAPGDRVAPVCAQPVNWTHTNPRDFGPDAIRIDISWGSSTGSLADLGNCTVREVVSYDAIPNPPFLWNPPNPTILTVPGTAGAGMDTHSYPPGLQTGITNPREAGTMVAHQVYQFRCTGPGCSGTWTNIPGQAYTITRKVFPQYVWTNPWRYEITKIGGAGFSYSRQVEVPTP